MNKEMKAYVLNGVNDLRYTDVEIPVCSDGWAVVQVKAAGICSSDIPRIFTKGTYHFPTIPGHEFSGIVETVGNVEDNLLIGKKVGIFPLIPCRTCVQCKTKHYEMCEHYDYLGSRRDGGFAEYALVPVWNLIPVSDSIPFTLAAMLEPLSVALHAMKLGNIQKGQSVCIIGTGMIGIAAAQWAYKLGAAEVVIVGRNKAKQKMVESIGLDYVCSRNALGDRLFDVVLEAVGTPDAIEIALESVKPGGVVVVMGNPAGDILLRQDVYWRILRKQLTVRGTWNSFYDGKNRSDWTETVAALEKNEINVASLITHTFSQEHLASGLELMNLHKENYCKVMTIWNDEL